MAQVGRLSAFAGSKWIASAGSQAASEAAAAASVATPTAAPRSRPDVEGPAAASSAEARALSVALCADAPAQRCLVRLHGADRARVACSVLTMFCQPKE